MAEPPIARLVGDLVAAVERRDLRYMLAGSLALRLWGLHHPSNVFEMIVDADADAALRLCRDLQDQGIKVPDQYLNGWMDEFEGAARLTLAAYEGPNIYDIEVTLVSTPYHREALERRRRVKVAGLDLAVIAPEDLLLHKLLGGRPRDMVDASEILIATPGLDMDYVRLWAQRLDVEFNLSQAETEARDFFGPPSEPG